MAYMYKSLVLPVQASLAMGSTGFIWRQHYHYIRVIWIKWFSQIDFVWHGQNRCRFRLNVSPTIPMLFCLFPGIISFKISIDTSHMALSGIDNLFIHLWLIWSLELGSLCIHGARISSTFISNFNIFYKILTWYYLPLGWDCKVNMSRRRHGRKI